MLNKKLKDANSIYRIVNDNGKYYLGTINGDIIGEELSFLTYEELEEYVDELIEDEQSCY